MTTCTEWDVLSVDVTEPLALWFLMAGTKHFLWPLFSVIISMSWLCKSIFKGCCTHLGVVIYRCHLVCILLSRGNDDLCLLFSLHCCLGASAVTSHVCRIIERPHLSNPKGILVVWEIVTLLPRSYCCLCWVFCAQPYSTYSLSPCSRDLAR